MAWFEAHGVPLLWTLARKTRQQEALDPALEELLPELADPPLELGLSTL